MLTCKGLLESGDKEDALMPLMLGLFTLTPALCVALAGGLSSSADWGRPR